MDRLALCEATCAGHVFEGKEPLSGSRFRFCKPSKPTCNNPRTLHRGRVGIFPLKTTKRQSKPHGQGLRINLHNCFQVKGHKDRKCSVTCVLPGWGMLDASEPSYFCWVWLRRISTVFAITQTTIFGFFPKSEVLSPPEPRMAAVLGSSAESSMQQFASRH